MCSYVLFFGAREAREDRDLTKMVRWCDGIMWKVWLAVQGRWALDFGIPHYAICD